jgi:prepilin-type N-terminal cleavage/methylation domain-containing protein
MKGMRTASMRARNGFTLVELLVVIGIIVILAAILYPVFGSVREKARQAACRANLHQIAIAMKQYRDQWGRFPFDPYYDANAGRWLGGVSALYPDFISDKKVLVCQDDVNISTKKQQASDECYSSYNGYPTADLHAFAQGSTTPPDGSTAITGDKRTYNYYGYGQEGYDAFTFATRPYASILAPWLRNEGLSWRHYPRLYNRQAPDNTYVTHCLHHRRFYKGSSEMDAAVTLGGDSKMVNVSQMSQAGSDATHPSKWVSQKN